MTEYLQILVNETNGPLLALPEHSVTSLDVVHCGDALAVLQTLALLRGSALSFRIRSYIRHRKGFDDIIVDEYKIALT